MSLIEYDFSCKPCEGSGKAYVLTEKQSGGTYWKVVPCWHSAFVTNTRYGTT